MSKRFVSITVLVLGIAVLMGGLAGAFVGYGLWLYVAGLTQSDGLENHAWAGAMIGLVAFMVWTIWQSVRSAS